MLGYYIYWFWSPFEIMEFSLGAFGTSRNVFNNNDTDTDNDNDNDNDNYDDNDNNDDGNGNGTNNVFPTFLELFDLNIFFSPQ